VSVATLTLGGSTLPMVKRDGCRETIAYLGGQTEMASGAYAFDLFSLAQKRRWELSWVALVEADVAVILAAYALLRTDAQTFQPPLGAVATVQRDGEPTVNWFPAGDGPRADVTMKLREL
jgi:hypothetical protein